MALSKMTYVQQKGLLLTSDEVSNNMGINIKRPKFPQYSMLEKRQESYKTWPSSHPLSPRVLAEAGLVYTGSGDSVRCFYCGGGLRNWEEGDSVWVEHTKWYPTCPHIMMVKGSEYIKGVIEGRIITDEGDLTILESTAAPVEPSEALLTTVAAESCLLMGFNKELVKAAIRVFIKRHGHLDFKGQELAEIVFEMEENGGTLSDDPVTENTPFEKPASKAGPEDMIINDQPEIINCKETFPEKTEELLKENERLKELKQCKICLDATSSVIFLPCGHMVSCPQCAPALSKCPICRQHIKGTVKAYFA